MTEQELEGLIMGKESSDNARFILGKLLIEGSSDKIAKNESKGLNWLKEAVKKNHMDALEYKTYWEIRFSRQPQLAKIKEALEKVIEAKKSCRALNTMAELNHASAGVNPESKEYSSPEHKEAAIKARDQAAKYYMMSAEQGDVIGMHWIGVFYHEGYGVTKNP